MNEDDARAWRQAYRASLRPASPACPADEALAALAVGDLPGAERPALAGHVVACRECTARVRTLLDLHESARPRRWRQPWAVAAAAAVVLALAGALAVVRGPASPPRDVLRGGTGDVRPAPGAALERAPTELWWPAQAGATSYRVRVFDAGGDVVWQHEPLAAPPARPPAGVLSAGRSYFWTVEPAGGPRERLGPFWFEISPAP